MRAIYLPLLWALLLGGAFSATGQDATGEDRSSGDAAFERDLLPVLRKHCAECHGERTSEAKLKVTSRKDLLFGSASGHVLVPGAAKASLLVRLVQKNSEPHMPPEGQLSDAEIATLEKWIASLPGDSLPARTMTRGLDHWAFQPVAPRVVPSVTNVTAVRTATDRFLLAKLEAKSTSSSLSFSPDADRRVLIRRASFDLLGLPPTLEEIEKFVRDERPDAFERLLDRLLASPAYGERWARHWLDLARYADSGGFHDDLDRPHAWRYRDYVIRALNEDRPYARFVREQLAGDEIAPHDADALIATGFNRHGPSNDNNMGPDKEKYRLDQLDDVVSTTSAVLLGQTLGCARCHDHKYDPFSIADYYRLLAVFNNAQKVEYPLDENGTPQGAQPAADKSKLAAAIMGLTDSSAKPRVTHVLWRGDTRNQGPVVEPEIPAALASGDRAFRFPTPAANAKTTGRRSAFAEWCVSPDNPLTWRVIANRLWQHHFGRGIVATPSNFGRLGAAPTHPELLDWLATEMAATGGEWKPMHRELMTSTAYRQSSRWDSRAAAADPQNHWLWRMSPRRLEAEAIRDAVLSVAGTLNRRMAGAGIKPRIPTELLVASQRNKWPVVAKESSEHWRRGVYVYVKRQLPFPMLELFDSPSTSTTCERRDESIVPTQALVLMNDQFTQDQAEYFAQRVLAEVGDDIEQQANLAIMLALGHEPTPTRLTEAVAFLRERNAPLAKTPKSAALADLCHVLLNCNEFVYVD